MFRLSQLTTEYVNARMHRHSCNVQKVIFIIWIESFENAGYAEYEVGDRVRELLS